jgi:hypothetical protein
MTQKNKLDLLQGMKVFVHMLFFFCELLLQLSLLFQLSFPMCTTNILRSCEPTWDIPSYSIIWNGNVVSGVLYVNYYPNCEIHLHRPLLFSYLRGRHTVLIKVVKKVLAQLRILSSLQWILLFMWTTVVWVWHLGRLERECTYIDCMELYKLFTKYPLDHTARNSYV